MISPSSSQSSSTSRPVPRAAREPVRTCIGCRAQRSQAELLRFRRRGDGHVVPTFGDRTGRGAYLCPSVRCYKAAIARQAFRRTFGPAKGLTLIHESELLEALRSDLVVHMRRLERFGGAAGSGPSLVTLRRAEAEFPARKEGA